MKHLLILIPILIPALLLLTPAFALDTEQADEYRGAYAAQLLEMAEPESGSFAIECGDSTVFNTNTFLQSVPGYDAVACVLDLGPDKKAAMVAIDATESAEQFIEHFALYAHPDADNPNVIQADDLDLTACEDPTELGNGWARCDDAIDKPKYKLYMRQGTLTTTYLFTYNFNPDFDQGLIEDIIEFFRNLFGLSAGGDIPDIQLATFTRGYFAQADDLQAQALFHGDTTGEGDALIVLQNFAEDYSTLVDSPGDYELGDHKQVLHFDDITYVRWQRLTSALRLTPTGAPPLPGDTCGNEMLGFDEECEASGNGFLSHVHECNEILDSNGDPIYHAGTLGCDTTTCTLDVSDCIKCTDLDDDTYPTTEGVQEGIKRLRGTVRIGSLQLDTSYDPMSVDWSEDTNLRTGLGVGLQAVVLPRDTYFGSGLAATSLETESAALLANADCDLHPATCLASALSSDEGLAAIDLLSGFVRQGMDNTINPIQGGALCTWNDGLICDEIWPGMLGFEDASYTTLFGGMATDMTVPFGIIESQRSFTSMDGRFMQALACGAIARATQTLYIDEGGAAVPTEFLFGVTPTESPENYYDSYQACKAGVDAINALLIYNPGELDEQNPYYQPFLTEYDSGTVTMDGLAVDDAEAYLNGVTFSLDRDPEGPIEATVGQLVRTAGAKLYLIPAVADSPSWFAEHMLGAYRANMQAILFIGLQDPLVGTPLFDDALTAEGNVVKELRTVDGGMLYRPDILDNDARVLISYEGGPATVIVNDPLTGSTGRQLPVTISECSGSIQTPGDDGLFVDDGEHSFEDYETTVPADAPLTRFLIDDWGCFLQDTAVGICEGIPLDCDDTEEPVGVINPGADEVCGDNIDNDCDGFIDAADTEGCIGDIVPTIDCNYNGVCDDDEDSLSCSDCIDYMGCPTDWTEVWKSPPSSNNSIQHYTIYLRWDECGKPRVKVVADGQDNGNSYLCKWGNGLSGSILTKKFEWKAEFDSPLLFKEDGGHGYGNVHLENIFNPNGDSGWKVLYVGGGNKNAQLCWGVDSSGYHDYIGDMITLFSADHCIAHACTDDAECDPQDPVKPSHCLKVGHDAPTDLCVYDGTKQVGGKGGQDCPSSQNECETNADCGPLRECVLTSDGSKICNSGNLCSEMCEDWQYCKPSTGECWPLYPPT